MSRINSLSDSSKPPELRQIIINAINEKHPQTIRQLVNIVKEDNNAKENEILVCVKELENQGIIKLRSSTINTNDPDEKGVSGSLWYLITIAIGVITATLVFITQANVYPWDYARNFFGLTFVLFLPGYSLTKLLFPSNFQFQANQETLQGKERIVLSIGLSFVLITIVGFALYYTPFGLNLAGIVLSLFVVTSIIATAALFRENMVAKKT